MEGDYLIAKCVQAVRDGEAVLTAIVGEDATLIKLFPTGAPEDFDRYWEGMDNDECD